jgi:hypothetical protein
VGFRVDQIVTYVPVLYCRSNGSTRHRLGGHLVCELNAPWYIKGILGLDAQTNGAGD